ALSDIPGFPDLKVQRTQSSNNRETVDSGTLRHSRLAKNQKQWTVALFDIARRNSGQWHSPTYPAARIEAVAEFRLRIGQDCPVDEFRLHWEYTLNSHVHLHRLGVYTQPTWTFTDWEYTLNPHAPFTDWEYTLNPYALSQTGSIHSTHMPSAQIRTGHDCLTKHLHR
ncbi:unnamed protein product, partial [Rodentolepis nana]|uniref:Neur_chan_LBD domain-containing protein n=1 Tax=Rodentolepis nana TaxID=102285 RepID=A0A0R3T0M2_RODNA